jgi:fused signal recognition particle receptor
LFESLKKKFSRTSEKLEEELIEEAEAEDNLKEESGSRFSFFSFGRNKKEETEEDDDNLLPQAEEPVEEAQAEERRLFSEGAVLQNQIQECKGLSEELGKKLKRFYNQLPEMFMETISEALIPNSSNDT